MATINQLIASGGNVLNAQELLGGVQRFKANQLLLQNAPAQEARRVAQEGRAVAAEGREQSQFDTIEGLRQGISLMRFLDKDDIQGAMDFVGQDGITEKEQRVINMLQSGDPAQIEALKTGTKGLIETALLVGDIKGQAAAPEKFRAATQDELAGLGPDVIGAQVSETTGKLVNVQRRGAEGEGENLRRQKINDALRLNPNLSEQQATKVVDGQAKIEINEKTGNLVFTDLITQEVREIPFTTQEPATPTPPTGQSLFDLAGTATGPIQSIAGKVERTRAFLGGEAGEVTESQQRYKTEIQNMVRALSINPRFPVGEIDRIREEIDIQPSFFQGEEVLKSKLRSIDSSLRVRLAQAEADANNPNLDTETRQNQGSNASSIRNFLTIMGVPQQAEGELESRKQELLQRLEQLRAQ